MSAPTLNESPDPPDGVLGNKRPAAYIHVPFCRHRCGYCNFTLVSGRDDLTEHYLKAIERELSWLAEPQTVSTIFIGGGTPTHLSPADLSQLITLVRKWFVADTNVEFSVEANPSDINVEKVIVLRDAGVNRLSLGAQSFNSAKLKRLERDHDADTICKSVEATRPHIPNISLDLIFAAPDETLDDWSDDLSKAIHLAPKHISTYGLTIERGTTFWNRHRRNELSEIDDETQRAMYELAINELSAAGFEHYEVSNFSKRGFRSVHNENYWLGGEYFAIGPGAARYINGVRSMNHQSTTTYIKRVLANESPIVEREELTAEDVARERLVFGLRRLDGIDLDSFERNTGLSTRELVGDYMDQCIEQGLLRLAGGRLQLTRNGLIVSDSIWPRFLVP
jgi:oxygen-independent coproporphyrinogen-3 oxidase